MTVYDFDWNVWLPFFVLIGSWLACLWFAEKKKDVVIAVISLFIALILFVNPISASIFTILTYNVSVIFAVISVYEFLMIAIKR